MDDNDATLPGDDPTFQQLLMISGLFCGPVMFFIGGLLFWVTPKEYVRSRRVRSTHARKSSRISCFPVQWSFVNGLLAIISLVYLLSTSSFDDLPRQ